MSDEPIAVYLVVNGPLGMTAGKIASQAFQAAHRMLRAAGDPARDPAHRELIRAWEAQGTRTICRVAETPAVFARVCREVPGITFVDEGIFGCPPDSETIHAAWPAARSAVSPILGHKRVPLLGDTRAAGPVAGRG